MSRGTLLRKILYSPWFLASVPAFIIMLFLPPLGLRYTLDVTERGKQFTNDTYVDLNSDSITEIVRTGKGFPYFHTLILDNNLRIYDQWNLKDNLDAGLSGAFFGNCDCDKLLEIYIFSFKEDSLFLNVNEFFDDEGIKIEREFITRMGIVNNTITSSIYPIGFFDLNLDGFQELYFSIATGFGLEPRLVYYFDLKNKTLKSSPFLGVNCQFAKFADADKDGKPEIIGLMSASGNYKTPIPYTDESTWFMVFDEELRLKFPPPEFHGLTNRLQIESYSNSGFSGYVLNHFTATADSSVVTPRIMIYSSDEKLITELKCSDLGFNSYTWMCVVPGENGDRIFIMEKDLVELDKDLNIISKSKAPFNPDYYSYLVDIDLNGEKEFLFYSAREEELVITSASFQKMAEAKLITQGSDLKFSHLISKGNGVKLNMTSSENCWFIEMDKNRFFYLGYLAYPGIYLIIFLFIHVINKINTYQFQQKENLKQRLLTLQLQGIKSQLDPHFTFNTLNSIASLIYLEDRQSAYDYMNKFTVLLRSMLNDAERVYRSLGEEVEFVTTYLELEKLRFGDKFNYHIEISKEVSQKEQVPKLVLQTFAENAIKHGLMSCTDGGILRIVVVKEGNSLKLSIEDNGIGRENSSGRSTSTGKGLKITGEFYDILNQMNKRSIRHTLTDLYNQNNEPSGTRVDVWVPIEE